MFFTQRPALPKGRPPDFILCSPVTEQFLTFLPEKTASDGDAVIALLGRDVFTRLQVRPPTREVGPSQLLVLVGSFPIAVPSARIQYDGGAIAHVDLAHHLM